jgi:hypothetical protein
MHRFSVYLLLARSLLPPLYILLRDFVIKIHGSRKIIVRTKFPQCPSKNYLQQFPIRCESLPRFTLPYFVLFLQRSLLRG